MLRKPIGADAPLFIVERRITVLVFYNSCKKYTREFVKNLFKNIKYHTENSINYKCFPLF